MDTKHPDPINELWGILNSAANQPPVQLPDAEYMIRRAVDPLQKLRKNIRINSGYGALFIVLAIYIVFGYPYFWVQFLISTLMVGIVANIIYNEFLVRKVLLTPPADENIRLRLSMIHYRMKQALRTIEYVALIFYPISITAGFVLALADSGKLGLIESDKTLQAILIGSFVVLTPLCFFLTRWLNKVAFGKEVERIGQLVKEMEE